MADIGSKATYTPKLNLKKPDQSDFVNIDDLNGNADILDSALGGHVGEGGTAHKVVTLDEAGFMSPTLYRLVRDVRTIDLQCYKTMYTDVIPPTGGEEPFGRVQILTPKTLWVDLAFNNSTAIKTLMVTFFVRATAPGNKYFTMFETDDVTRVYINAQQRHSLGPGSNAQILLGDWDDDNYREIRIVTTNNSAGELSAIFGRLVNCEVAAVWVS